MVCTGNQLSEWKDFPKGLRVLLLDQNAIDVADIKAKLQSMDYIVSTFCSEKDAISAILTKPESFHVAIVEVSSSNNNGSFKFLETIKEIPTVMTSNVHCLNTMMKCIALGAVEFLSKPLSEDKLRNIWQHVVHKAFNAGGTVLADPPNLAPETFEPKNEIPEETDNVENEEQQSVGIDKYPAPSTPQLKQTVRLVTDGDLQDHTNDSAEERERANQDIESKSVETTSGNSLDRVVRLESIPTLTRVVKEEDTSDGSKSETTLYTQPQNNDTPSPTNGLGTQSKVMGTRSSKANRKKTKVDWTTELHKKFVKAVEQLGIDQAVPSRILELMKTDGLTRHNVASHLQKYRMHRRCTSVKEDDVRWTQPRDKRNHTYYPHKPVMAFPSYHPATTTAPVYPLWGAPNNGYQPSMQTWGHPGYPPWQSYPMMHGGEAWGCPVMPPPPPPLHGPCPSYPQNGSGFYGACLMDNSYGMAHPDSFNSFPADETINYIVNEAISKPWLPLPLGLKPPSTECVLAELAKISGGVPSYIDESNS